MKVISFSFFLFLFSFSALKGQNENQYFNDGQAYDAKLVFHNGQIVSGSTKKTIPISNDSKNADNIQMVYNKLDEGLDTIKFYNEARISFPFQDEEILGGDFLLNIELKLVNSIISTDDYRRNRRQIAKPAFLIGLRDAEIGSKTEGTTQFIGLVFRYDNQRIKSPQPFLYAMKGRNQLGSVALDRFSKKDGISIGVRKVGRLIEYLKDGRPFASFELESGDLQFDKLSFGSRDISYGAINKISVYKLVKAKTKDRTISQQPTLMEFSPEEGENETKSYALIIGNNNYKDPSLQDLDQPISDASQLWNTLLSRYQFDSSQVTFLKNASRRDMIVALDNLSNNLTEDDNLLIFYAGHGHWDKEKETGYWLPVDAEQGLTVDWVRNSTIQGYIGDIKAKHILLITDACFAGGIFKTRSSFEDADRSITNLYRYESRKALTSGMLNEVPDRSVFMENLLQSLNNNQKKYLSTSSLFFGFRENVMNNSFNSPQYGTIHNTGDKGGEFIFILKD